MASYTIPGNLGKSTRISSAGVSFSGWAKLKKIYVNPRFQRGWILHDVNSKQHRNFTWYHFENVKIVVQKPFLFSRYAYLSIAWTSAKGSILTSPPFQDLRLVQSECLWRAHFKWCVLKNRSVEPADLTPEDPEVISCILIGNCSKWLTQAFNFCTKSWNLAATSMSKFKSSEMLLGHPAKLKKIH